MRILIADDHEVVRRGLRELIRTREGWEVCAEANDGVEALLCARELHPDVAVLDVSMPRMDGLAAARRLHEEMPEVAVLLFTMHADEHLPAEALAAGARGIIFKLDAAEQLVSALEAVARGSNFFSPRISRAALERARGEGGPLTPREREVVRLAAEGKTNKEISSQLGISVKTVETHRAHVLRKLGVSSLALLVRYAVRTGLVEP
jgi:DNA-binding NarL/FixJ family response regulator